MQKQFLLVATLLAATTLSLESKPAKSKDAAEQPCCAKTRRCCAKMDNCCDAMENCFDDKCCKDCTDRRCKAADKMHDCCNKMKHHARHNVHHEKHHDRPVTDEENTLNPGGGREHYAERDGARTYGGHHKPKAERDADRQKRHDEK